MPENDQERLALQRKRDEQELDNKEWQRGDKRFDRIEVDLLKLSKLPGSRKNRVQVGRKGSAWSITSEKDQAELTS